MKVIKFYILTFKRLRRKIVEFEQKINFYISEAEFSGLESFHEELLDAVPEHQVSADEDDGSDVFFDAVSTVGSVRSERTAGADAANYESPLMPRRNRETDLNTLRSIGFTDWNVLPLPVIGRPVNSFIASQRGSRKTQVYLRFFC